MRRKILLPTDLSKNAWRAINYAIQLYKNDSCQFYILNVRNATDNIIDNLIKTNYRSKRYEDAKLESKNGLVKILEMLAFKDIDNPKHHFKTISKCNNTVQSIKNIAEEKDIEIIVMGTKGKTGSRKVAYGRTALNIMEKVRNCPVIVVPEFAKYTLPREIVFTSSLKTHLKKQQLNYLIDISNNCNATIKILHASKEDKLNKLELSNKKFMEAYFEDVMYSFDILSHMEIATAIKYFFKRREGDMVAVLNKKHGLFGSMLTHPLVKNIGQDSNVPLLVMHDL